MYLPLFPAAIGAMDLSGYDLVVSSSHCVAKGAVVRPGTPHVCYCHTPMRYAWDFREVYFGHVRPAPVRWALDVVLEALRAWDTVSASRVDHFVANSSTVARRIRRYYGREASIIHPPVDTDGLTPVEDPSLTYFLVLSALVPYKRIDLAIRAANRMRVPLKVVGDGTMRRDLARLAGPTVELVGEVSRDQVRGYLANAKALVFPGEEDFGITPLEANACGRPVVAYRAGGASETMHDGETAVFFDVQEVDAVCDAMHAADALRVDARRLRANALRFSIARFRREFSSFLVERIGDPAPALARDGAGGSGEPGVLPREAP
jgi:glycosyltransferase involved in cell wall biosynthesis